MNFIMAERDLITPTSLARAYYEEMAAPDKGFFLSERSAHFPHYEEPEPQGTTRGEWQRSYPRGLAHTTALMRMRRNAG